MRLVAFLISVAFSAQVSPEYAAEELADYRKKLESSWDWKDLPGMAPDYGMDMNAMDYGDMPGAPGGR